MTMLLNDKQEQMLIELLSTLNCRCKPMQQGKRDGGTMGAISAAIDLSSVLDYELFYDPNAPYIDYDNSPIQG